MDSKSIDEKLQEIKIQFLLKELETLKDLYVEAEHGVQNIFNFFLTFISASTGGLVIIVQLFPNAIDIKITICAFLVFIAIVGILYVNTLSFKYANLARYGNTIDEMRRYIINEYHIEVPKIYRGFLGKNYRDTPFLNRILPRFLVWIIYFFPTGTYQMFVSAANGLSLSLAYWLIWGNYSIALIILVSGFIVTNLFSRIIKEIGVKNIMSIDVHR